MLSSIPSIHLIPDLQGDNLILDLEDFLLLGLKTLTNLKTELEVFGETVLSAGFGVRFEGVCAQGTPFEGLQVVDELLVSAQIQLQVFQFQTADLLVTYKRRKRGERKKGANKGYTLHLSLRISCWIISIFIIFCNRGPSLFKSSFPKLRLSSSSSFKFLYNELHFKFIIFLFTTFTKKKQIKISKRFYASSRFIFFL